MSCKLLLRSRRQQLGLTTIQIANLVHASKQSVRCWELGTRVPNLELWPDICAAYRIKMSDLVTAMSEFRPCIGEAFRLYKEDC